MSDTGYTAQDFMRRVQQKQQHAPISGEFDSSGLPRSGDHLLNPDWSARAHAGKGDLRVKLKPAAVLVPVVDYGDHASVLLTTRNAQMRSHSGQVAFPGGKIDADDLSPEHAALREANEEIGLEARHAQTLGRLPQYMTGSGYAVTPVLAVIRRPFELHANPDEVADIFEVPLSFLMDPQEHQRESRIFAGHERFYYAIHYQNRTIWGATAGIIRSLYERLYA
ncbi:CoA pyrophosphatase [Pseudochrobactrum sp. MP213Fo]|uniref:CoA pyrophosphatase n=1 Tax=Pseudochrobactrum sp. MP213Fo TaxID=3022250 RepID=UPI003B9EE9AD